MPIDPARTVERNVNFSDVLILIPQRGAAATKQVNSNL
jgi:hypothetical protein